MKIVTLIVLFYLICVYTKALGQKNGQQYIDSLLQELPRQKEDTNKVNILNTLSTLFLKITSSESIKYGQQQLTLATSLSFVKGVAQANTNLGRNYNRIDPNKSIGYFQESIKIYEQIRDKEGLGAAYSDLGYSNLILGEYEKAKGYCKKAIDLLQIIGNKKAIATANMYIGNAHYAQSDYKEALKSYTSVLKIYEETNSKTGIMSALGNIGGVYTQQGNYPKGIEFFLKALKIAEEIGDKVSVATAMNHLGETYYILAEIDKAKSYLSKSLKMYEEIGDKYGKASSYMIFGNMYYKLRDNQTSLEYNLKALQLFEMIGDLQSLGNLYSQIANNYLDDQKYDIALQYKHKGLKVAERIGSQFLVSGYQSDIAAVYILIIKDSTKKVNNVLSGVDSIVTDRKALLKNAITLLNRSLQSAKEIHASEIEQNCYQNLTEAYKLLGDLKMAIEYSEHYHTIKDTIFSKENDKKIMQEHMNYEYSKREDSIKLESEKKEIALQKEIELKAVRYEFEKKQAAAKSEKERQQLKYEQQLKEQQIENDYAQKTAKAEAQQKQKEAIARVEQEKKDALTAEQLKREKNIRYASFAGAGLLLIIAITSVSAYRQKKRDNQIITKEKQRSEDLLLNILPAEVAEELKDNGSAKAKSFDLATVLFTDFKGFTHMSEKLSAEELVYELNTCFKGFDEIIHKYGIEKIKTIGDSYMAVGGLPDPKSSSPEKVVQAALEMSNFILKRRAEREKEGKLSFEMRVGIHTGPVVAGIVGIKKFQYDIWGDTVNTASRMESSGEVGRVNISGTTYELVKDKFKCDYRGKVSAKGKGEVDMYFVS